MAMGLKIVKHNAVFRNEYGAATIVNKFALLSASAYICMI